MENDWVDIDNEWEDIVPIKKSPLEGFFSMAKSAFTPTFSPEQVDKNIIGQFMARSTPIVNVGGFPLPPPFSQVIPPQIRNRLGAETVSAETSPAAIIGNIMAGGGLLKQANMLPKIMGKAYTLRNAEMGAEALGKVRMTLGQAKKQAISNVADVLVNTNEVPLNNLPSNVMKALEDPLYGIERNRSGVIRNTVSNLDRVKEALGDFMTTKTWEEASKKSQQVIKQTYGKLNEAMKSAAKNVGNPIDEALNNYHNFMTDYTRIIRTIEDTAGNVVEKPFRSTFTPFAERGKFEAWQRMGKQSPEIAQVIKNMKKYSGRRTTQAALGGLSGLGLLSYMAHRYLSNKVMGRQ
ncbi:MAG: hypothetical protein V1709_04335 [Planctomycetota bacterium]